MLAVQGMWQTNGSMHSRRACSSVRTRHASTSGSSSLPWRTATSTLLHTGEQLTSLLSQVTCRRPASVPSCFLQPSFCDLVCSFLCTDGKRNPRYVLECLFYRDLKLDNTLLDGKTPGRVKLCDFGFAKQWEADKNMFTHIGYGTSARLCQSCELCMVAWGHIGCTQRSSVHKRKEFGLAFWATLTPFLALSRGYKISLYSFLN